MTALPTARLLPLLMMMAMLMLGTRGYSFWNEWNYGGTSQASPAQASPPSEPMRAPATAPVAAPAAPAVEKPAEVPGSTVLGTEAEPAAPRGVEQMATPPRDENMPGEYMPAEVLVLQSLGTRRAELDQRAAELDQREALIEAAQQSVSDKVGEL